MLARCGNARLLRINSEPTAASPPVILIPSLINSHRILDLSERTSLARHLVEAGFDPMLVDWGSPDTANGGLDLASHVTHRLVPLLRSMDRPPILVGYCLGGTLTLAAARLVSARAVVTIATPWHFDRYPKADLALIGKIWTDAKPLCSQLGYLPMEVMQTGFWALDARRTIRKYADFADADAGSEQENAFLAVEDWANEGEPLSFAAARDLFEGLYIGNMSGTGNWCVGGTIASPEGLPCPTLSIRSGTDRIVPATASPELEENLVSALGHVGMIVSARAREQIWKPLSEWLSALTQ